LLLAGVSDLRDPVPNVGDYSAGFGEAAVESDVDRAAQMSGREIVHAPCIHHAHRLRAQNQPRFFSSATPVLGDATEQPIFRAIAAQYPLSATIFDASESPRTIAQRAMSGRILLKSKTVRDAIPTGL